MIIQYEINVHFCSSSPELIPVFCQTDEIPISYSPTYVPLEYTKPIRLYNTHNQDVVEWLTTPFYEMS